MFAKYFMAVLIVSASIDAIQAQAQSVSSETSPAHPLNLSSTIDQKVQHQADLQARRQKPFQDGPRPAARGRLGKKFWMAWGTGIALMVIDAELTSHCSHNPACVESNPFFGRHPSRARIYLIKLAPTLAGFYFSQKWKRDRRGDTWGWWAFPAITIGFNGAAVAIDLSHGSAPVKSAPAEKLVGNVPASKVEVLRQTTDTRNTGL